MSQMGAQNKQTSTKLPQKDVYESAGSENHFSDPKAAPHIKVEPPTAFPNLQAASMNSLKSFVYFQLVKELFSHFVTFRKL